MAAPEIEVFPDENDDNPPELTDTLSDSFTIADRPAPIPTYILELPVEDRGAHYLALEMVPGIETLLEKEARKAAVQQFVEIVKSGVAPEIAAKRVNKSLPASPHIRAELKELVSDYAWNAEADQHLVAAGRRKVALESLRDGDRKNALAALDAIASDPRVGLKAPPMNVTVIDMTNIQKVLDRVDDGDYQVIDVDAAIVKPALPAPPAVDSAGQSEETVP